MYVFSVLKKINFSRIAVSFIMCTNGGSLIIPVCEIPIITTYESYTQYAVGMEH
jgi:hypothetical protein